MKTCPKCGYQNQDDYKFCENCGYSLISYVDNNYWLSRGVLIFEIEPPPECSNMSEKLIHVFYSYLNALRNIKITKNNKTYFFSYDCILDSLLTMKKISELKKRKSEYNDYTTAFIIRTWNQALFRANQLKTERGRTNRIQKYFDDLESWSTYLKPIHYSLIEHIKFEQKMIFPLPIVINLGNKIFSSAEDVESISINDNISNELRRSATILKHNDRLDLAIACLRKANEIDDAIGTIGITVSEKDYLRLVNYIKLSGNDELAMQEETAIYKKHPEFIDKRYSNLPRITSCIAQASQYTDYVLLTTNSHCKYCSKYNKQVYSISGNSSKFPQIPSELVQIGGFCPKCSIGISLYFDSINQPLLSDTEEDHIVASNQYKTFPSFVMAWLKSILEYFRR